MEGIMSILTKKYLRHYRNAVLLFLLLLYLYTSLEKSGALSSICVGHIIYG